MEKDIKHATARFKALQTMITNLESKKNRLLEEVEQLNQDRESGKISAEEAKARLEKIHSELREVDEKIADKTQKLHTAERQLDQLQSKTHSAEKKFEGGSAKASEGGSFSQQDYRQGDAADGLHDDGYRCQTSGCKV